MFRLFQMWSVGASLSWLLSFDGSGCFCSYPISGTMRCHLVLFFPKPGICWVSEDHWALTMEADPETLRSGPLVCWALMGGITACIALGTKWEVTSVHFSPWTLISDEPLSQGAGTWWHLCSSVDCGKSQGAGPSEVAEAHLPAASSWAPPQRGQAYLGWVWMGSLEVYLDTLKDLRAIYGIVSRELPLSWGGF